MRTNEVVATVADTPGAEGIEYVPELKKFYTSKTGDETIGVVDMRQMKVVKKLRIEAKPGGLKLMVGPGRRFSNFPLDARRL